MCGIVGYAGFFKKHSLNDAITTIKHRGPDDYGIEYFDGIALGNTRLAILDLSPAGHQPMFNKDKSLCIVFNGEIYNFKEIKKLLEKKYSFKSHSDTETILYAYEEWGIKCLEKLNGMFSFVIYDRKKDLLFGARDRVGQKPFKYYYDNNTFIFASEIKAILSLLNSKPDIDEIAIDNFLTLQYVPAPKTGFKKIFKLPAGHYFIYKNKKLSVHKYWSLDFTKKNHLSTGEWEELIFYEMKKSVKSHMISDVPVGALLSGGLDSSVIVALLSKYSSERINTFSIGFDNEQFNETRYARLVSQLYNTNHTELIITANELIGNIEKIVSVYDEPIADNSIVPTMLVSKLASTKVKVALTGDGGDENFAGYERYLFVKIADQLHRYPRLFKKFLDISAQSALTIYPSKLTERMKRFFSSLPYKFHKRYINYNLFFTTDVKHDLYSPEFKKLVSKNETHKIYSAYYDNKITDIDNALMIDVNTYLPDDLLYKSDYASMAYGLELRAPFLDHTLLEKTAEMPDNMKVKFFTKKKLLKDIAIKYKLLPKEIVYRRKQGFIVPLNKWFKGPLKDYVYETITSSKSTDKIFNKEKIRNYLNNYYKNNLNYDNNIFALFMLSLWFDAYQ